MAVNVQELVRVKNRILGVLLRDAREASGRSLTDCAALLGLSEEQYRAFEAGLQAPTLPQLEVLAYFFNVPLGYFWGAETLSKRRQEAELRERVPGFLMLRQRMIGVKLRKLREGAGLSLDQAALRSNLSGYQVDAAERGVSSLPVSELDMLIRALGGKLEDLIDGQGKIEGWIKSHEEFEAFSRLPPEVREFVLKPINESYIQLAIKLSQMDVEKLRDIAAHILEITL